MVSIFRINYDMTMKFFEFNICEFYKNEGSVHRRQTYRRQCMQQNIGLCNMSPMSDTVSIFRINYGILSFQKGHRSITECHFKFNITFTSVMFHFRDNGIFLQNMNDVIVFSPLGGAGNSSHRRNLVGRSRLPITVHQIIFDYHTPFQT